MALLDHTGKPIQSGHYVPTPSRESGSFRGSIANWHPRRVINVHGEARERNVTQRRAHELAANDWLAKSGLRSIADNSVGTGLVPKSTIPCKLLGISKAEAAAIGEKMEWAFALWSAHAHAGGQMHFEDLQYLGITSILRVGEMLHLPVMIPFSEDDNRPLSLAIQPLRPERLCTPLDLQTDPGIRDGIEFTSYGRPVAYWIASPAPSLVSIDPGQLTSMSFSRVPAMAGHRKNVFHLFRHDFEEQTRGVSQLSTGMKLFRHLNDAIDSELFSQVIAASFPIFIGIENGQLPGEVREQMGLGPERSNEREMEVSPGTVIFGEPNEKPYILENNRPGGNFAPFVEIVQRSLASMLGIPYESLTKDFSKTNYSSMRAALNEAWKLYSFYRRWFARLYTQPVWEMVIEEAYLRNWLGLADDLEALSVPGFYEGFSYWTSATWTGPAKGFIDPVKEIQATILALENRLMTYADAWAERGGDFADALPIMEEEKEALKNLKSGETVFPEEGKDDE